MRLKSKVIQNLIIWSEIEISVSHSGIDPELSAMLNYTQICEASCGEAFHIGDRLFGATNDTFSFS